jgi:hypothetical protein
LGIGRGAKGVVGLGVVSKFLVVALRTDLVKGGEGSGGGGDPMAMYGESRVVRAVSEGSRAETDSAVVRSSVTTDGINWGIAKFPHSAFPSLKENAYVCPLSFIIFHLSPSFSFPSCLFFLLS